MRKYSDTMMDHVLSPRNGGVIGACRSDGARGHAGPRGVSDSVPENRGRSGRGGEVSHGRLRADDRVRVDVVGAGFGAVDRGVPRADGRGFDRGSRRCAAG